MKITIKYFISGISIIIILSISSYLSWKYYFHPRQQEKELAEIRDKIFMNSAVPFFGNQQGHYLFTDVPVDTILFVKIRDDMPKSTFHMNVFKDSINTMVSIIIQIEYRLNDDTTQTHLLRDTLDDWGNEFYFLDFNFDSFRDIAYVVSHDNVGNPSYHYWLYDSVKNVFVFNNEYSKKINGFWCIDQGKKEISLGYNGMHSGSVTYGFLNGQLTIIEETSWSDGFINDTIYQEYNVVRRLIGGELKEVERIPLR